MKLLFLYGSPAVGKLTVAKEIAKRTNFKVFHNHLTVDAVTPVFEFGTEPFNRLVDLFRIEIFKEAAKANVNLIFTFCYAKGFDDDFIGEVKTAIEKFGGEICYVSIKAERNVIEKRVLAKSRTSYKKVCSVEKLNKIWARNDYFSTIPHSKSLELENTHFSVVETANKIIQHFQIDLTNLK